MIAIISACKGPSETSTFVPPTSAPSPIAVPLNEPATKKLDEILKEHPNIQAGRVISWDLEHNNGQFMNNSIYGYENHLEMKKKERSKQKYQIKKDTKTLQNLLEKHGEDWVLNNLS